MATVNLGRIGPVQRGAYSGVAVYKFYDIVQYDGITWLAKRDSTGVTPVEGLDWTSLGGISQSEPQVFIYGDTPVNGGGIFGGVIRNDGTGWAPIIDANHNGVVGFNSTITVSNNRIILTPNPAPSKNITNVWGVDETYVLQGIGIGASSGVGAGGTTQLAIASPASMRIAMGAPPTFANGNPSHAASMTVHWALASYTVTGASGTLAVGDVVTAGGISCTVTFVDGTRFDVSGRNNSTDKYQPLPASGAVTTAGGYSATISARTIVRGLVIKHFAVATNNGVTANYDCSVQPRFMVDFSTAQFSSTETRLMPYALSLAAQIQLDTDAVWKIKAGNGGLDSERNGTNAWTFTWNSAQNALDVTHPEVCDFTDLSAQSKVAGVNVLAINETATSIRIRFSLSSTGGLITPSTSDASNFNFTLRRGRFQLYNLWTGHCRVNFPVVQLDPNAVSNAIGNFWGIGVYDATKPIP